jgi:electron transfer flavoprotein alpha subunit
VLRDASFIVLPGSPDGRDLAGRLGVELGWPVIGGAIRIGSAEVTVTAFGGIMQRQVHPTGRFVATLQPGVRSVTVAQTEPGGAASDEMVRTAALDLQASARSSDTARDATTLSIEPPDAATVDLAEAKRIIGGGAGLLHSEDLPRRFEQLREIGAALGAAMGATRVVTDAGYIGHSRQIGTTGVVVNPDLYLAFGISGAVQHTSGLGHPEHIISVNTDPHCPMMALADLAVVADAPATLDELEKLLRNAEQTERHTND